MKDSAQQILTNLRNEAFSLETDRLLNSHPLINDAESGSMEIQKLKTLICEQYHIVQSDKKSCQHLVEKYRGNAVYNEFFQSTLDAENFATGELQKTADALELSEYQLQNYQPQPAAQAYPSYFCRLAHEGKPGHIAGSFAVNFPAWGSMCRRLRDALLKNYQMPLKALSFLNFFADEVDLDEKAIQVITEDLKKESNPNTFYNELKNTARLLQGYEVMFWDSINSDVRVTVEI